MVNFFTGVGRTHAITSLPPFSVMFPEASIGKDIPKSTRRFFWKEYPYLERNNFGEKHPDVTF